MLDNKMTKRQFLNIPLPEIRESEEAEEISFKTPKLAVDLFSTEF